MRGGLPAALASMAALLVGCVHPRWSELASKAATLEQLEASPPPPTLVSCEPAPVALGDYGFAVQCGTSTTYVRCGYHHSTACCWPVESAQAATSLFGQSQHWRANQVCAPLW